MRWLVLLPLALLLILFGISNVQLVTLTLWPFPVAWPVPVSIAVLAVAAVAFFCGALVAWSASIGYRRRMRRLEAARDQLQRELDHLRALQHSHATLPARSVVTQV